MEQGQLDIGIPGNHEPGMVNRPKCGRRSIHCDKQFLRCRNPIHQPNGDDLGTLYDR